MRKVEKMKITELLHLIVELTDPSMSRMEAWKAASPIVTGKQSPKIWKK